jgi:hypothetical protein
MKTQEYKQEIPPQIQEAMNGVLELLKSENLPEAIAKATFPRESKPCSAWSFSNRLFTAVDYIISKYPEYKKIDDKEKRGIFLFSKLGEALKEMDYRGFNQWKTIDRHVMKGATASWILAPLMVKFRERYYVDKEGNVKRL